MHASTMAETALPSVASHKWDVISPPALRARSMVSRIEEASRSTAKTLAPSRAKITAMARPLPQPGPTQPAPTTIATLPSSLPAMVLVERFRSSNHMLVIPGRREAASPESITADRGLWIPGSPPSVALRNDQAADMIGFMESLHLPGFPRTGSGLTLEARGPM